MRKMMKNVIAVTMTGIMVAALPAVVFASEMDAEQERAFLTGLGYAGSSLNTSSILALVGGVILLGLGLYLDRNVIGKMHF